MTFLESLCVGEAHEVITGLSCLENRAKAYTLSWQRLEKRFGNPKRLMAEAKKDLLDGPPVKDWDAKGLRTLGDKMYKCESSFRGWGKKALLNNDDLLQKLFCRVPYKLRTQFVAIENRGPEYGTFSDLRELVENAASEADSEFGQLLYPMKENQIRGKEVRVTGKSMKFCNAQNHSLNQDTRFVTRKMCPCCGKFHGLWRCDIFKLKSIEDKRTFLKQERLCFNCFNAGHRAAQCNSKYNILNLKIKISKLCSPRSLSMRRIATRIALFGFQTATSANHRTITACKPTCSEQDVRPVALRLLLEGG